MELNNLDQLADQIYQEGISKATEDSKKIIEDAESRASAIVNDAKSEADRIIKAAEKEAETHKERAANEVRLASKQAVSELQNQIRSLLSKSLIDKPVEDAFESKNFVEKLVLEILEKWSPEASLQMELSDKLSRDIQDLLQKELPVRMKNLKIKTTGSIGKGFVIESGDDGYFISFTEEDLRAFLKDYLSVELQKLLFE